MLDKSQVGRYVQWQLYAILISSSKSFFISERKRIFISVKFAYKIEIVLLITYLLKKLKRNSNYGYKGLLQNHEYVYWYVVLCVISRNNILVLI